MTESLDRLEVLVRETSRSEEELIALAIREGVKQLWRERTLARYVRGQISREEAVREAGIDWVELAELQREAMLEDLKWAMEE